MKKLRWMMLAVLVMMVAFVPVQKSDALEETASFIMSATVPAATGISIIATENEIVGTNEVFGPVVTAFDFNVDGITPPSLDFDTVNKIYISDHFYAIDVAATGGAGSPQVVVSYGAESNPAGQANGFGVKATATFNKVTGGPLPEDQDDITMAGHGTKLLQDISGGETMTPTELLGGFLRVRVGIYDGGDTSTGGLNDQGGEPFTAGDLPGPYSGTVTVTATL